MKRGFSVASKHGRLARLPSQAWLSGSTYTDGGTLAMLDTSQQPCCVRAFEGSKFCRAGQCLSPARHDETLRREGARRPWRQRVPSILRACPTAVQECIAVAWGRCIPRVAAACGHGKHMPFYSPLARAVSAVEGPPRPATRPVLQAASVGLCSEQHAPDLPERLTCLDIGGRAQSTDMQEPAHYACAGHAVGGALAGWKRPAASKRSIAAVHTKPGNCCSPRLVLLLLNVCRAPSSGPFTASWSILPCPWARC